MTEYKAKTGDMWDLIAYNFFGDEKKSTEIMAANPRLVDIVVFKGGEKIFIPDTIKSADNSTLAPWRR